MSRAKDRARAESGIIFRDGKLVNKEDWYKAHPTRGMLAVRQAAVKSAVKDELAKKFGKKESEPETYFCTKCSKYHRKPTSAIYKAHVQYGE